MSYIGVGECIGVVVVTTRYIDRAFSLFPPLGYFDSDAPVTTKRQTPGEVRLKNELTQCTVAVSEVGRLDTRMCVLSETR